MDLMTVAAATASDSILSIPTGLGGFDHIAGGLRRSELVLLEGTGGTGKSTLALRVAVHAASVAGVPVGYFTLESSRRQLMLRLVASECGIRLDAVRRGGLDEGELQRAIAALRRIEDAPMFVDDTADLSADEIVARARAMRRERNALGLVVVDSLEQMRIDGGDDSSDARIDALQRLAVELQVAVVAVAQSPVKPRSDVGSITLEPTSKRGAVEMVYPESRRATMPLIARVRTPLGIASGRFELELNRPCCRIAEPGDQRRSRTVERRAPSDQTGLQDLVTTEHTQHQLQTAMVI